MLPDCLLPSTDPLPSLVNEGVGVVLEKEVLQHAALGHKAEEVEVAAEEDVQPHLNVIAVLILRSGRSGAVGWH